MGDLAKVELPVQQLILHMIQLQPGIFVLIQPENSLTIQHTT